MHAGLLMSRLPDFNPYELYLEQFSPFDKVVKLNSDLNQALYYLIKIQSRHFRVRSYHPISPSERNPQVLGSHPTDTATAQIESSPMTSPKFWLFEHVYQVQRKKSQQLSGFTAALHWPWKQSCRILRLKKQLKYYTLCNFFIIE